LRSSGTLASPGTLILLTVSLVLSVAPALGQIPGLRTLTGTVTDRQKEPLKGAVVEVQNESTSEIISYITEADGTFSFKRLSTAADYRVTASYRTHKCKPRELSHFSSKLTPTLKLVIKPD
jgi:hypothetical protein